MQSDIKSEHSPKPPEGNDIPKFKLRQNNAMDYQSDLQALYIYLLLLNNITVEIGSPNRLAHLTKQFIKIKKLSFPSSLTINTNSNSTINVQNVNATNTNSNSTNSSHTSPSLQSMQSNGLHQLSPRETELDVLLYIQKRSKEQAQFQKENYHIATKTAERRIQSTKRRECMRLLEDILLEFGYIIEIEKESIHGYEGNIYIFLKNQLLYDSEKIRDVGELINRKIGELLSLTPSVTLNSSSIPSLLQ